MICMSLGEMSTTRLVCEGIVCKELLLCGVGLDVETELVFVVL